MNGEVCFWQVLRLLMLANFCGVFKSWKGSRMAEVNRSQSLDLGFSWFKQMLILQLASSMAMNVS